ncbi:MAG: class I SAM-dependent methyltransferase [Gammaproteobacteria bacterium]
MQADPKKDAVATLFNQVSTLYDCEATRFFTFCGERLVNVVKPEAGTKLLDVATGTGAVAVPMAQAIGPEGRVTGIDLSAGMLGKAEANIKKIGLNNIDLFEMDAENLDFNDASFDSVVCSYGLFFMPDMLAALQEWRRVVRPAGKVVFTSFETTAFQPMMDGFLEKMAATGVDVPTGRFGSHLIESVEHCRQLLQQAGLENINVHTAQLGYHLANEADWWTIVTNTAMRHLLEKIPADRQEQFRVEHLDFVKSQMSTEGLWLDVDTRFAVGHRPA